MKVLLKKLMSARSEISPILKTEKNPFFKSNFFDINSLLDQINHILIKNDLLLMQPIEGDRVWSKIYDVESQGLVESYINLPALEDPQKMGSAITYYRRYTLQSLLGLQAHDDDDANSIRHNGKPNLVRGSERWDQALEYMSKGGNIESIKLKYILSPSDEASLRSNG